MMLLAPICNEFDDMLYDTETGPNITSKSNSGSAEHVCRTHIYCLYDFTTYHMLQTASCSVNPELM